jgi:hypothetical protein
VGFVAIPWSTAGSVLFTLDVERALDEIHVCAGVLVVIQICGALAPTSPPVVHLPHRDPASGTRR